VNELVRTLAKANLAACAFAYVAAYASYMYDWLNVGGGHSDYQEQWILLSGTAPFFALLLWLGVVASSAICWRKLGFAWGLTVTMASLLMAPAFFIGVVLFLHRNFPPSPV
jgi:hypothetical protein